MVHIINQPFSNRLGDKIIELLNKSGNERFDNFYILSAFVKKSGLSRIQGALLNFKRNGGIVKAVVGINQQISSREGLLLLKQLSNESYVYYNKNRNPRSSFHPKMYIFEKDGRAVVFIGSSNLTSGGLFTNYELDSMVELDLTQESERNAFSEYLLIFQRYSDLTQPTCKELTNELIENLDSRRMLGTERQIPTTAVEHEEGEETEPFGSESFGTLPPAYEEPALTAETPIIPPVTLLVPTPVPSPITPTPPAPITIPIAPTPVPIAPTPTVGFWKRLTKFDVSTTSAPGQMIIPIRFQRYFPQLRESETPSSGGEQADINLNIVYIDAEGRRKNVNNARLILYAPAPHHPRKNTDIRFTFLDRTILEQLVKGDILEFRRTGTDNPWFEITRIPAGTPRNLAYSGKYRDF